MNYRQMMADLVFPPRCPACGEIVSFTDRDGLYRGVPSYKSFVHRDCFSALPFLPDRICPRCGLLLTEEKKLCDTCLSRERTFDAARSVFLYDGVVKDALMGIKYSHKKEYADFFGYAVAERLSDWLEKIRPDVIVPVPVSRERERERGYNQAEVIAESIRQFTGIPVQNGLLIRNVNTAAQKDLTPLERKRNLEGAFSATGKLPEGRSVLLADDIYTTGATAEACAAILKRDAGAKKVYVIAMAGSRERTAKTE